MRQTLVMASDHTVPRAVGAEDLYSLRLDEFVTARDELADRLRSEGRDEEAGTVAKLRKPSVAAWALNRVARNSPGLVDELFETHRNLRAASSSQEMQTASEQRRKAIAAVEQAAAGELGADGRAASGQTRERIVNTLLAIATDAQGEADLKSGALVRELAPSGGGWGDIGLAPPSPVNPGKQAVAEVERARGHAERLEREAADAERQLEIAKRALTEAKRRAKQARARSDQANEKARLADVAASKVSGDLEA
jgi:hypothetical protein